MDLESYVTYSNAAITVMTGYDREQLIGKHFTKIGFLLESDIPNFTKVFSEVIQGKPIQTIEIAYRNKTGGTNWSLGHISVLKLGEEINGVLLIVEEIT